MRRGRQNFELKLFGCKNVPYVGQINVRWWGKIFGGTKSSRGRQKASGAPKSSRGRKNPIRKTEKNSGDLFLFFLFLGDSKKILLRRGAKNFSRGRRMVNMVNVTPLNTMRYILALASSYSLIRYEPYLCRHSVRFWTKCRQKEFCVGIQSAVGIQF